MQQRIEAVQAEAERKPLVVGAEPAQVGRRDPLAVVVVVGIRPAVAPGVAARTPPAAEPARTRLAFLWAVAPSARPL